MSKRTIFYFASIPFCLSAIILTYVFLWYTVTTTDASKGRHYRFKVTATVIASENAEIPVPMDSKTFPSDC